MTDPKPRWKPVTYYYWESDYPNRTAIYIRTSSDHSIVAKFEADGTHDSYEKAKKLAKQMIVDISTGKIKPETLNGKENC